MVDRDKEIKDYERIGITKEKIMTNTVETKDKKLVWIDTCYTPDCGWETIVVRANKNGEPSQCKENWMHPLMQVNYKTKEDAVAGHKLVMEEYHKEGKK